MLAFAFMAYDYYQKRKETLVITFVALAILFQPFYKIALGRALWNILDVVVAIILVLLWLKKEDCNQANGEN